MLSRIKSHIKEFVSEYHDQQYSKQGALYDMEHIKPYLSEDYKLSKEEKEIIQNKWKSIINCNVNRGFAYFQALKKLYGFDSSYVPSAYYTPFILAKLNPLIFKGLLTHKSLVQLIFNMGIKMPKTILRSYGSVLFNSDFKPILKKEALKILENINYNVIIKPAQGSRQGQGIKILDNDDIGKLHEELKNDNLRYKGDFVIQEIQKQSMETMVFNPSSLNCLRVTTFNINNEVSVGSIAFKCGAKGNVVDNIGGGKGGIIIGLNNLGQLNDYGFYGNGEKGYSHNDIEFKGKSIKGLNNVIQATKDMHKYINECRIIGWDMAIDPEYNPILIESNINGPAISMEQMVSGPIFGDRTDEVLQFLRLYK